MPTQTIPCKDCDAARERFEERGFRVLGCTPHGERPGMCVISFEPPGLALTPTLEAASPGSPAAPSSPSSPMAAPAPAALPVAKGAAPPEPEPETSPAMIAAPVPTSPAASPRDATLTPTQVRTAQAIVNIFETGAVLGHYGQVTLLPGDPGRLTYGRSQTSLGSGNLHQLLLRYCSNPGARFGQRLAPSLPAFAAQAAGLDSDTRLHNLLRACADDPVMRETQDAFFDESYWRPALRAAERLGLRSPLAVATVYDSQVHGSWALLRDRTRQAAGEPADIGERAWTAAYVRERRAWLASNKIAILRNTVYRMDALQRLIDQGFWGLALPLVVRDSEISIETLNALPPQCYDGPQPGTRALGLQQPLLRGLDVRLVQLSLSDGGADIKADGVFGQASVRCVKELQIARGLPVTGLLDVAAIGDLVR